MRGKVRFHPVGSFVADFQQQCGRLSGYKKADSLVHARLHLVVGSLGKPCQQVGGRAHTDGRRPAEALGKFVQCPQSGKVALSGYHGFGSQCTGHCLGQFVGSADMSGKDGNGMFTYAVHANYGRVCVLVLHARGDGTYADA